MHVLVNAVNVIAAGPRALVLSLLPSLVRVAPQTRFTLLLPDESAFQALPLTQGTQAVFVKIARGFSNDLKRLRQLLWDIPRLVRRLRPDVCLTLGDLAPVALSCPQVIFFHLPLLVYSKSELANISMWPLPKRLYLTWHFARSARQATYIAVQTPIMMERLSKRYGIDQHKIVEIPQPFPKHITAGGGNKNVSSLITDCSKPIRLLFLASYYPHKNHAILPAVADELRRRRMVDKVQIFVTLDDAQRASAGLRGQLRQYPDVFTNLGWLVPEDVAGVLRTSTALFLPSLAETYGLIYLEAMACGVPILTSDRDFARWMCQDLALYFDPLNPLSIVDTINALSCYTGDTAYPQRASQRLSDFPKDWDEVARLFWMVLQRSARQKDV